MKQKIKVGLEIDLATAECYIYARYWEDSAINGVEDNFDKPLMPCVIDAEHFHYGRKEKVWNPIIDLDNGRIINWEQGNTASIHYRSCDKNVIIIKDRHDNAVKRYEGYVPNFLCPKGQGYRDYAIMDIDENGYIQNFNNNLDDIFDDE